MNTIEYTQTAEGVWTAVDQMMDASRDWLDQMGAKHFDQVALVPAAPRQPTIITDPQPAKSVGTLSGYLRTGRQLHPLARGAFVKVITTGYYHYERKTTVHTCAVAAAYAGAFGPEAITDRLSYSMACWRLAQRIGWRIDGRRVVGPTGRLNTVGREMMALVDDNWWTREGVAEWLESMGM